MIVFSTGQAEQYGYYKKVTNWSTIFDNDLAEEIANPERLALGTLVFPKLIVQGWQFPQRDHYQI